MVLIAFNKVIAILCRLEFTKLLAVSGIKLTIVELR